MIFRMIITANWECIASTAIYPASWVHASETALSACSASSTVWHLSVFAAPTCTATSVLQNNCFATQDWKSTLLYTSSDHLMSPSQPLLDQTPSVWKWSFSWPSLFWQFGNQGFLWARPSRPELCLLHLGPNFWFGKFEVYPCMSSFREYCELKIGL